MIEATYKGGPRDGQVLKEDWESIPVIHIPEPGETYMLRDSDGTLTWNAFKYIPSEDAKYLIYDGKYKYTVNVDLKINLAEKVAG